MTRTELESVRFLKRELRTAEEELSQLRKSSSAIVSKLKEMPRRSGIRSKVEELVMKVIKAEERVGRFKAALTVAQMGLTEWILSRHVTISEQHVTLLLYAEGLTVREVGVRTGFSRRHVARLAAEFLEKCHLDSTQNR